MPEELRARNKALKPLGRRICRTHQGQALPLDDEHFYRTGAGRFDTECKTCVKQRVRAYDRARIASDPSYAELIRALDRDDYQRRRTIILKRKKRAKLQRAIGANP